MSTMLIQSETLENIADAIREKCGIDYQLTPADMVTEINAIEVATKTFNLSNGHVRWWSASGFNDTFISDSDGYLTLIYVESNCGGGTGNFYIGNTAIGFNRSTWNYDGNKIVGIIHARVREGETFTVKCTDYGAAYSTSGYILFGSKDYTADGSPIDLGTNIHNALTQISGNTSSLSYTAKKSGTVYAVTIEKNVTDSGRLFINDTAQTQVVTYQNGNHYHRMHQGHCNAGDTIQVKPTYWYGGNSTFIAGFIIIDDPEEA